MGQQNLLIPPGAPSATVGVTTSDATVSGIGVLNTCARIERVLMNIDHTFTGDVAIFLISPAGTILELTSGNGGSGNNWRNTTFRDDATRNIVNGGTPYTGTFRPEGRQQSLTPPFTNAPALGTFTLANTFDGEDADGVWQLYVNDYVAIDVGEILNWEIEFSSSSSTLSADLQSSITNPCEGERVEIDVIGVIPPTATFLWNTGEMTPSISDNPTMATTYSVTVTDGDCEQELDLTVTPTLPPTISGQSTICESGMARLTATGQGPFNWSNGGSGNFIDVSPTTTTSYTVRNGTNTCNISEAFVVTVQPIMLDLTATATDICAGAPVTLEARGGSPTATYLWNTGAVTSTIDLNPTVSREYSVTLTEGSCTLTDRVMITTNNPSVAIGPDRSICSGERVTLIGTGTGPFRWSNGGFSDAILVAPDVTTTYTASTTRGACTVMDTVVVAVIPDAMVTAPADQNTCAGTPVTLTAAGTGPFTWSTGEVSESITVAPTATTTYTVNVGAAACAASDQVRVTVTRQPDLDLGEDRSFCAGGPNTLTAFGDFTDITWNTGQNVPTIDLHTEGTVTYIATGSIADCTVSDTVTISIFPTVSLMVDEDASICTGESANLSATGTGPFRWSTGETGDVISVAPSVSTSYTVTAGGGDCAVTEEVNVVVIPLPTADLGPDQTACVGDEIQLSNATVESNYNWSDGSEMADLTFTATADTTYSLTVISNGCRATDSIEITVPQPRLDLGPDQVVCPADSLIISAPDASAYDWSNGFTGQTLRTTADVTQDISLTAIIDGCPASDTLAVAIVNPAPLSIQSDLSICPGEAVSLGAESDSPISWSTGEMGDTILVSPVITTSYFATVGTGNCTIVDSVEVEVQPAAVVDLGDDLSLCLGDDVILSTTSNGASFEWSTGDASETITVLPTGDTTYSVVATTADGCTATDSVDVRVIVPFLEVAEPADICPGDTVFLSATGSDRYSWENGQTANEVFRIPSSTSTYSVTGFTENCPITEEVTVNVRTVATVDIGGDETICPGDSIQLTAAGDGPFTWNTGEREESITVSPTGPTTYFAVAGSGNCSDTAFVEVNLFPQLSVELGEDVAICQGSSTSLSAEAGTAVLTWQDGNFPADRQVMPQTTTTYRISATENGCEAEDSITVTVNDLPRINLIDSECSADNATYSVTLGIAGGQAPYTSDNQPIGARVDFAMIPSDSLVNLTVADENGCLDEFSQSISCGCRIIEIATPPTACNGSEALTDLNTLLPAGAPRGEWFVVGPASDNLPTVTGSLLSILGSAAGTYTLQFTPDGASLDCLPDYQRTITVIDPPFAGIQAGIEERCVESGGNIALFEELTGATPGGSWESISNNTVNNEAVDLVTGIFRATGQAPGDYVFRYQAPEGIDCAGSTETVVIRLVEIEVAGTVEVPNCDETCSGAILVTEPGSTNMYSLDEDVFADRTVFTGLCPGEYSLRTEDDRGCTAATSLLVPETVMPQLQINGRTEIVLGDSTLLVLNANTPLDSVTWAPAVNCQDSACLNVYVRPGRTAEYSVRAVTPAGCEAVAGFRLLVDSRIGVYVPTAFSPNKDGVNDLLTVYAGTGITAVEGFEIFDRWGSRVMLFPTVPLGDPAFGWDGRSVSGKPLQIGVYVYQLTFTRIDGTQELISGEVMMMR